MDHQNNTTTFDNISDKENYFQRWIAKAKKPAIKKEDSVPGVLVLLVGLMVVSTFFDKFVISNYPLVDNLSSVMGLLLVAGFIAFRINRYQIAPIAFLFLLFIVISGAVQAPLVFNEYGFDRNEFLAYAQYIQVFVLFIIIANLATDIRVIKGACISFLGATTLMSFLSHWGVTLVEVDERVGIAGLNLNYQALMYNQCIIGVFCFLLSRWPKFGKGELILVFCAGSCLVALAKIGSRGGSVTLLVGLVVCLPLLVKKRILPAYFFIAPIFLVAIVWILVTSEVLQSRLYQTISQGNTGLRYELLQASVQMFLEKPFYGWGANYPFVLGDWVSRGRAISTHNTYTQILVSFGAYGFAAWLLAHFFLIRCLWKTRKNFWCNLLLILLISVFVAGLSQSLGHSKYIWILIGLSTGAYSQFIRKSSFSNQGTQPSA